MAFSNQSVIIFDIFVIMQKLTVHQTEGFATLRIQNFLLLPENENDFFKQVNNMNNFTQVWTILYLF